MNLKNNIKKMLALLVFVIFLLSVVPVGLAHEEKESDVAGGIKERVEKIRQKYAVANFAEGKDIEERLEKARERVDEALEKAEERLEKARERFEEARERYKDAKDRFEAQRQGVDDLKARFAACQEEERAPEGCRLVKEDLKQGYFKQVLNTLDVLDRALDRLEERLMAVEGLMAAEKETALDRIAMLRTHVEKLRVAVKSETMTAREALEDAKELWKDVRQEQKATVALLVQDKLEKLLEKHHGLERSMEVRIASLEQAGGDATELKAILERFQAHVSVIEENYATAKAEWQAAKGLERPAAWEKWWGAQKAVRDSMKASQGILREFVQKFVELKQALSGANETEDVEEAPENETETDEGVNETGEGNATA